jgi:putative Holliday junction resolvase
MKRLLALDVGTKRIGLALTDELRLTAQPFMVIERKNDTQVIQKISQVIEEQKVEKIIVGLPYDSKGKMGKMAKEIMNFMEKLKTLIKLPIIAWEEAFTTNEAQDVLIKADLSRKRRKGVIDKVAAALILDCFLRAKDER